MVLPLSYAQQRLWFLDRLQGADATYHLPVALRLTGPLDIPALQVALADVTTRHESLRSVFPEVDSEPVQHVLAPEQARPQLLVTDARAGETEPAIRRAVLEPFDLGRQPPLRATLFLLETEQAILLLVLHHIGADGWSMAPLLRDLSAAYRARAEHRTAPDWPELPVQYADYALWQRELLGDIDDPDSRYSREVAWWVQALNGLPEPLPLPTDRPRPAVASRRGAAVPIRWSRDRHQRLLALARAHDCTLFMVIQAGLVVLLSRLGAGTDIPIGTVVAGRTEEGLEDLVGFFVNTLVLRTDVSGDPDFVQVLRRVRDMDLGAYAHQDLPFDCLVQALNPPRTLAHHPLFQVLLVLENVAAVAPDFGPVCAVAWEVENPAAKVDLTFQLRDTYDADATPAGLVGSLEYATDLFDETSAEAFVTRLTRLLDEVADTPGIPIRQIDLLGLHERRQILAEWNATERRLPETTLHAEFSRQATRTPRRTALISDGMAIGYRELNARANRLAHHLTRVGVRPGDIVAVAVERSPALVVSLLAVLKAGAAFLPLDSAHPADRLAYVVREARPTRVLADSAARELLRLDPSTMVAVSDPVFEESLAELPDDDPSRDLTPDHPAYLLYTSGSTGRPKGVLVSHGAIANRLRWMQAMYPLTGDDRVLQKTPSGFDVSVWEFFWPLQVGATLVLAGPAEHLDPARIAHRVREQSVTIAHFVPSMLRLLLAEPAAATCTGLRRVFCSGEALTRETADEFHRVLPNTSLENLYGPTEAAIDVTAHTCRPGERGPVPIGRPVDNTRVFVLDDSLRPSPVGVPGELYLAGVQLAQGYLGRPALTAASFVANPYGAAGERMYRTGDVVRWLPGGVLGYLGRSDRQVKLRGQRLELGEIESVLVGDEHVAAAHVLVRESGPGEPTLAAYVTPAQHPAGGRFDPARLRRLLVERLPEYMVPATVTVVESFPLTPNGKLDVAALPVPSLPTTTAAHPGTPLEAALARLFEEVLDLPRVGVDDDFFTFGGHSMLAVRLVRRVCQDLGIDIGVQNLFRRPTVRSLAYELSQGEPMDAYGRMLPLRSTGGGVPLFFVPPGSGLSWCYYRMLGHLDKDRPVYALQAYGFGEEAKPTATPQLPTSTDQMAEDYLEHVLKVWPEGPYNLLGWSFGGIMAHVMATRLQQAGREVARLVVFDSHPDPPTAARAAPPCGGPAPGCSGQHARPASGPGRPAGGTAGTRRRPRRGDTAGVPAAGRSAAVADPGGTAGRDEQPAAATPRPTRRLSRRPDVDPRCSRKLDRIARRGLAGLRHRPSARLSGRQPPPRNVHHRRPGHRLAAGRHPADPQHSHQTDVRGAKMIDSSDHATPGSTWSSTRTCPARSRRAARDARPVHVATHGWNDDDR